MRYGHFKVWLLLYIVFYSCNACKNKNLKNCFKIVVHHWLFVVLMTLNEILTCEKIQLCTHNQSWDKHILKCKKYCILCYIVLIHVKIEFLKTTSKLLYMIDYLWFNNTIKILTCWKILLCTPNQNTDMHILKCNKYYIVFYISNACNNFNFKKVP